jgi:hypothetical protein
MRYTYAGAANSSTNGVALGVSGQDVYVKKLIIGLPVATGNVYLYNKSVAYSGDTDNIACKFTIPSTISYQYTNANGNSNVIDFASGGKGGLQLDGGLLMIDQAMQVTVVWTPVDDEEV